MKDLLLRLLGTGALAAVTAGLAYFAMNGMSPDVSSVTDEPDRAANAAVSSPATKAVPDRSDVYYQAILDRPVFEVTRRPRDPLAPAPDPEPAAAVASPEPAPELPPVSLLGVMSGGSRTQALIAVEGGEPVWLLVGDRIGGWTITGAGEDWLDLAAENKKVRLELFE